MRVSLPCGYAGDLEKECSCRAPTGRGTVAKCQNRISGPILDRIDTHLEVQRVPIAKLASLDSGEPSSAIRVRVEAARARQAERFAALGKPSVLINADMGPAEVQTYCQMDEAGRQLLRNAAAQLNLSARAYHRVLKLARTIADLAGYDFSRLAVWQAFLRGKAVQDVDFSHADLSGGVFTETFGSILSVALSPDGAYLAAGTGHGLIRLWQAAEGWTSLTPYLNLIRGENMGTVHSVCFSPDARILAGGSDDQSVRLWDVQTGECFRTLRSDRPYERMNITGASGLSASQMATLKALGAVAYP